MKSTASEGPEGRLYLTASESYMVIFDAKSGQRVAGLFGEDRVEPEVRSLYAAFDPSGARILWGTQLGLRIWDWKKKQVQVVLRHPEEWEDFTGAEWSPGGERVATSHADGSVRVWDATTGKVLVRMPGARTAAVAAAAWHPGGRWVLTTEPPPRNASGDVTAEGGGCVWDARTGLPVPGFQFPAGAKDRKWPDGTPVGVPEKATTVSPDGARKVEIGPGGTIRVLHAGTAAELLVLRGEADGLAGLPRFASWSPDGHRLLVSAPGRGVTILDATPLGR